VSGQIDGARVEELLAFGGAPNASAELAGVGPRKYDGLADPSGAEELGAYLAEALRPSAPAVVLIWEDPEDVVLGHVVARELGLRVVRVYDADGLVGHSADLPDAPRCALVADAIRDARVVLAVRAIAEQAGGELVATAVLVMTAELRSVTAEAGATIALVEERVTATAEPA
jgi:adenine/guanine phosphoribosyltransferase-like PRPP-binding protein